MGRTKPKDRRRRSEFWVVPSSLRAEQAVRLCGLCRKRGKHRDSTTVLDLEQEVGIRPSAALVRGIVDVPCSTGSFYETIGEQGLACLPGWPANMAPSRIR